MLVIDSLSHAWMGKDGALEQVDRVSTKTNKGSGGNNFAAWRLVTPQHNRLVEALIRCKCHLIVTMRARTEYVVEQNERGKSVPRKVGTAPVQREGIDYEFDVVGEVDLDHTLVLTKSRCFDLADAVVPRPDASLGRQLREWLDGGEAPPAAAPAFVQVEDLAVLGAELAAGLVELGMTEDDAKKALWSRSGEIAKAAGAKARGGAHLRAAAKDLARTLERIASDGGDGGSMTELC